MLQPMTKKVDYRRAAVLILVLAIVDIMVIGAFWSVPVNVSNNAGASDRPSLAVDGDGQLHLVWADDQDNYPGNSEIFYRSSADGGTTWKPTSPLNLSNSAERSFQPKIAIAGNQRIVAWADGTHPMARLWNGSNWLAAVTLSSTVTPTLQLSTAINSDGIALVAWTEGFGSIEGYESSMIPDVRGFYRRWNGSVWEPVQPVAARMVTMRGNLAYLVTERGTLLRSENAGLTWGTPLSLPNRYRLPQDMQIDSTGTLHLAWLTDNSILVGSYDGLNFSTPAMVDAWAQFPLETVNSARIGAVNALALAINDFDQLGLVWAAPMLDSITTNYRPNSVNNRGASAAYRIMSSQSLDGRTWTTPVIQSVPGGFPALAVASEGSSFYGAWRSLGDTPDVFVAVNHRPEPGYLETFDAYGRLFAKGIDMTDGTAKLNSANPLDWPLFGSSQSYGNILRGQTGADELLLLGGECLKSFNTLTGQLLDLSAQLCLPLVGGQQMTLVDGLVQGSRIYLLTSRTSSDPNTFLSTTTPYLLLLDRTTDTLTNVNQPPGLPNQPILTTGASLAVTPDGGAVYVVLNDQLYRYQVATNSWSNLTQAAQAVVIGADGTIFIGHEQNLLSSPNGENFTQRATNFSTRVLYIDRDGCVIGVSTGRITGFRPTTNTTVSNSGNLRDVWRSISTLSENTDGTVFMINIRSFIDPPPINDQLLGYRCATNTLNEVTTLPSLSPRGGGLVVAADNRIWFAAREISPTANQNQGYAGLVAHPLNALRGEVVSPPIFSGSGGVIWGTLTYSVTVPVGASFAVDVLDQQGTVLRENVASGTNLAELPAVPLHLRARMEAPNAADSPVLDQWQLSWQPIERRSARLSTNAPLQFSAANGTVNLNFPAGAVSEEATITFTEQVAPSEQLGALRFAGRSFTLVATKADDSLIRSFNQPFTISITYSDAELAAAQVRASDLDLVFWDGLRWVSTRPLVDQTNRQVIATLDHLTEFALVGSGNRVYLPLVRR